MDYIDHHYQLFVNNAKELAKSIVVKFHANALSLNRWLSTESVYAHIPIESDPRTWRYYLNISGEYHYSNHIMKVVSMDTLEEIEFNKENLKVHRATLKEYQYGTDKYEELVARYPNQEQLILGILYPADIEEAIQAEDGKILSYPPFFVEENEYSFILHLQEWINGFLLHHYNHGFSFVDNLYTASVMGMMYLNMIPAIMNIRKRACKTNEAHSFHVRQYLASHGFLDDYLDTMTKRQSLRFYMNICWIERNIGKTETQKWLIEEVLTVRRFPLAEYTAKHDIFRQPQKVLPEMVFTKKSINKLEEDNEINNLSLEEMLAKEEPLAPGNRKHIEHFTGRIDSKLKYSLSNRLKTKILQSKIVDYSNIRNYKLLDTLFNLWLDLSASNVYTAYIQLNDPKTGERIPLKASDAFILYYYCFQKAHMKQEPVYIPDFSVKRVPYKHLWSVNELKKKYPMFNKEDTFIEDVLDLMVYRSKIISIEAFYEYGMQVNEAENLQYMLASLEEKRTLNAHKRVLIEQLYAHRRVNLTQGQRILYQDWLSKRNIEFNNYKDEDYFIFATEIFKESVGLTLSSNLSLRTIHSAMIRLMTQLSSYSVQYIKEITDDETTQISLGHLRTNDQVGNELSQIYVNPNIDIIRVSGKDISKVRPEFILDIEIASDIKEREKIDRIKGLVDVYLHSKSANHHFIPTDIGTRVLNDVEIDQDGYYILPDDVVKKLPLDDHLGNHYWYQGDCTKAPSTKVPNTWIMPNPNGDGFALIGVEEKKEPNTNTSPYKDINELFRVKIVDCFLSIGDREPPIPIVIPTITDLDGFALIGVQQSETVDISQIAPESIDGFKAIPDYIDLSRLLPNELEAFQAIEDRTATEPPKPPKPDRTEIGIDELVIDDVLPAFFDNNNIISIARVIRDKRLHAFDSNLQDHVSLDRLVKDDILNGFADPHATVDIKTLYSLEEVPAFKQIGSVIPVDNIVKRNVLPSWTDPAALFKGVDQVIGTDEIAGFKPLEDIQTISIERLVVDDVLSAFTAPEQRFHPFDHYSEKVLNGFEPPEVNYLDDRLIPVVLNNQLDGFQPRIMNIDYRTEVNTEVSISETYIKEESHVLDDVLDITRESGTPVELNMEATEMVFNHGELIDLGTNNEVKYELTITQPEVTPRN